ncbi:WD40 repeat-like protein [Mycena indigotica]|uniref:WD40 repeat-like protein n=1 Tax=Mycena indigotica TaxID=2126181 RepID=A0A8H6S9Z2_9AGAR|nr:WD40 repeat-like protein [Mycena indigotica]KAF7295573.1 WD40 repeat-like protein [Mycena indigotica]
MSSISDCIQSSDIYRVTQLWRARQLESTAPIHFSGREATFVNRAGNDIAILSSDELLAEYGSGRRHIKLALVSALALRCPQYHWSMLSVHLKSIVQSLVHDDFIASLARRVNIHEITRREDIPPTQLFCFLVAAVWRLQSYNRLAAQSFVNVLFASLLEELENIFLGGITTCQVPSVGDTQKEVQFMLDRMVLASQGWTRTRLRELPDFQRASNASGPRNPKRPTSKQNAKVLKTKRSSLPHGIRQTTHTFQFCRTIQTPTVIRPVNQQGQIHKIIDEFFAPPLNCPMHQGHAWLQPVSLIVHGQQPINLSDKTHWDLLQTLGRQVFETIVSAMVFDRHFPRAVGTLDPETVILALTSDITFFRLLDKAGVCPATVKVAASTAAKAFKIYVGALFWTDSTPFSGIHEWLGRLFTPLIEEIKAQFTVKGVESRGRFVPRTLATGTMTSSQRDILTLLSSELSSRIICFLPLPAIAGAALVSKSWFTLIYDNPLIWTSLLQSHDMFWGSEAAFLRAHKKLPFPHMSLFKSRYLTKVRWTTTQNPAHCCFFAHRSSVVTSLILSRGRIISASDDHSIQVHDLLLGQKTHTLQGHEGGVWALAATGDMLVSGSTDRTVRIWDLISGLCTHVFGGHISTVRCLSIVHPEWIEMDNGRREKWPKRALIVTGSRDHTLRVWTLPRPDDAPYSCFDEGDPEDADDNPYHRHHLQGHDHAVRALAARGRTLVSGSYDSTVRVWDLVSGECRWVLAGHTQKVYSVVLDPKRDQACSGSMDGTVRIWDLKTGHCVHTLTGHTSLVGLLQLSPQTLVSASADATLCVWNPTTGALRHKLSAQTGAITCLQHDEFKVVSGSDGTLKMWNIRDGSVTRDLLTGVTGVWEVVFEGRWCVAASNQTRGGTVQTVLDVWDFAAEGEDWVAEPSGGVYDEGSDSGEGGEDEPQPKEEANL